MTVRRIPHLLVLAALAVGTTTGLAACGGEGRQHEQVGDPADGHGPGVSTG